MIKNVFFDLDGTLLPMDQDLFVKAYFEGLAHKLAPRGYEAKKLIEGIWAGTAAMVANDGTRLNEQVFWDKFKAIFGERVTDDIPIFDEFYRNEFDKAKSRCGYNSAAKKTVDKLKAMGKRVVLATNPIFPSIATEKRIGWAGLNPSDFELYTTYENTGYCKPNLSYYKDILSRLKMSAEETLMVGNDVDEDMVAEKVGMKVFLLTDCLINKHNKPITMPHGSFDALMNYMEKDA